MPSDPGLQELTARDPDGAFASAAAVPTDPPASERRPGAGAAAFVEWPLLERPGPDVARAPRTYRQRAAEAFDAVSASLPMLLMALVALGTWWLVKNTPLLEPGKALAPPRHEPDYTMNRFMVQRYAPDGKLKVEIEGEQMRHYPDSDTYEIDAPRLRSIANDGLVTRAAARRALANRDASEVQLSGGAQVTREASASEAAIDFRGEFLHLFQATEQVRSHLPVVVTQGANELRADGMNYDHLARVLTLRGKVRATLADSVSAPSPRRAASAARGAKLQ